jgi:poly-beta-hydroxybutyrate-responsive repressor
MEPPIWGFLQPCLLLILAEGPQHGYSLMDELSRRKLLGSEVDVGNLYRTLRRMEGEGLVTSGWSDGAGPNKRVYHISERGTELLNFWAGTLEERTRVINRFINEYHRIFGPQSQPEPEFVSNEDDNPI